MDVHRVLFRFFIIRISLGLHRSLDRRRRYDLLNGVCGGWYAHRVVLLGGRSARLSYLNSLLFYSVNITYPQLLHLLGIEKGFARHIGEPLQQQLELW